MNPVPPPPFRELYPTERMPPRELPPPGSPSFYKESMSSSYRGYAPPHNYSRPMVSSYHGYPSPESFPSRGPPPSSGMPRTGNSVGYDNPKVFFLISFGPLSCNFTVQNFTFLFSFAYYFFR